MGMDSWPPCHCATTLPVQIYLARIKRRVADAHLGVARSPENACTMADFDGGLTNGHGMMHHHVLYIGLDKWSLRVRGIDEVDAENSRT